MISRPPVLAVALAALIGSPMAAADGDELTALREQLEALRAQVQLMESRLADAESAARRPAAPQRAVAPQEEKPPTQWTAQVTGPPAVPDSVVHLAGYGAASYVDGEDINGGFGNVLFAPIFHYQYKDLLLFEGELEIEIEDDGATEVALEYVTLDLTLNDHATLVAGRFLSPVGQFVQNLHPSWVNKLPEAPPGFGHDQAAPLADVGLQLRGGFGLGRGTANYALFAANGPRLEVEFEAAEDGHDEAFPGKDGDEEDEHDEEPIAGEFELHGLESEGFVNNDDGELVFGGRIGFLPWSNLEIGLSGATGKIGVYGAGGLMADEATRDYQVLGADFYWGRNGFQLRGEYVTQEVDEDPASVVPDEAEWSAWYTQAAYRWPGSKWEGVLRYADFDALETRDDQEQIALGINYLFASNVIGKFSYEMNDGEAGTSADGDRLVLQLAYGF